MKWASLVPPSKTPLTLERLDENKHVAARYVLHGCWASELNTLPDLDASASPLAIERMRLEVEGWERE